MEQLLQQKWFNMSNKVYLEFEGFDEAIARLNKLNGNVKQISGKALKKTHSIITEKAEKAIEPHNQTHQTEKSLRKEAKIEWAGTIASVQTGFSISEGGLASIFLMYGIGAGNAFNKIASIYLHQVRVISLYTSI